MSFQSKINLSPAQGWHGDFASTNPRVSLLGNNGSFQVGPAGIRAGSFVWVSEQDGTISNTGNDSPDGFVGRELTGVTMPGFHENNMVILAGAMVTVFEKGEFKIELATDMDDVKHGDAVYVSPQTGEVVASGDKSAVATNYKYAEDGKGGDLVKISAWI